MRGVTGLHDGETEDDNESRWSSSFEAAGGSAIDERSSPASMDTLDALVSEPVPVLDLPASLDSLDSLRMLESLLSTRSSMRASLAFPELLSSTSRYP